MGEFLQRHMNWNKEASSPGIITLLWVTLLAATGCGEDRARVRFFVDISSKAPQPRFTVQFIFVLWNEGRVAARNVVLNDPLVQMQPKEHLSLVNYVPGSMSINREYHPNTSAESYFFVERAPLTDADDSDEGTFDEASATLFFRMAVMEPDDYVVWAFEVKVNEDAPCESSPIIQNIATASADNSPPYENGVAGHIVCQSPRLRLVKSADVTEASPGSPILYTLAYSLDPISLPEIDPSRFDIRRVRIFDHFPGDKLEVISVDGGGEVQGDVIFWQIDLLKNGGSGSISWRAKIKSTTAPGTEIVNRADILSQNTVEEQNVGGSCSVWVASP